MNTSATRSRNFKARSTHPFVDKPLPLFSLLSSPFPKADDDLLVLLFVAELLPEAGGVVCSETEVSGS